MLLFIDRLPLARWAEGTSESWFPLLPVLVGEPEDESPAAARCRLWKWDTGNTYEAYAWRFHLQRSGLYPCAADRLAPRTVRAIVASGRTAILPVRKASLWLVSNLPHLRETPLRIPLYAGIPFVNEDYPTPSAQSFAYPLLGIRACRRVGLTIRIDLVNLTLSVWTPESWLWSVGRFLRRFPDRFARLSLTDLRQDGWID